MSILLAGVSLWVITGVAVAIAMARHAAVARGDAGTVVRAR